MITRATAKQELFEIFAENKAGKPKAWLKGKVKRIYNHEPLSGLLEKPVSITLFSGGTDEDDDSLIVEIRIYVDGSKDALGPQTMLDELMDLIDYGSPQFDGVSPLPAQWSRPVWETGFEDAMQAFSAVARVKRGREDY